MLRIPFFIEARTASWSIRSGKLNDRENSPTLRSEIQYLASGSLGVALAGAFGVSGTSSTVAWCPSWPLDGAAWRSSSAACAIGPSTSPGGGVPEV